MARLPRLYAPGVTQLAMADFLPAAGASLDSACYRNLTRWLAEAARTHEIALQGWSLTAAGIGLLATPNSTVGVSRVIQSLGRNLASSILRGGVFAHRYRSTLLQPGAWVLPALIWLERMPLREGLVEEPDGWPWSSAQAHTGGLAVQPAWLAPHVDYWACGNTPFARQAVYRQMLQDGNPPSSDQRIAAALHGQWALGDEAFINGIAGAASRRLTPRTRGRPRKAKPEAAPQ